MDILKYIEHARDHGFEDEHICQRLVEHGWETEHILAYMMFK